MFMKADLFQETDNDFPLGDHPYILYTDLNIILHFISFHSFLPFPGLVSYCNMNLT